MSKQSAAAQNLTAYLGALVAGVVAMFAASIISSYVPHFYVQGGSGGADLAAIAVDMLLLGLGMSAYVRLMLGRKSTLRAVLGAVVVVEVSAVICFMLTVALIYHASSYIILWDVITGTITATSYMVGWKTAKVLV